MQLSSGCRDNEGLNAQSVTVEAKPQEWRTPFPSGSDLAAAKSDESFRFRFLMVVVGFCFSTVRISQH